MGRFLDVPVIARAPSRRLSRNRLWTVLLSLVLFGTVTAVAFAALHSTNGWTHGLLNTVTKVTTP